MVIDDFHIVGVAGLPPKAETPLFIDPDAVLPGALTFQLLEPVSGRSPQIVQSIRRIKQSELLQSNSPDVRPSAGMALHPEPFGIPTPKPGNHFG